MEEKRFKCLGLNWMTPSEVFELTDAAKVLREYGINFAFHINVTDDIPDVPGPYENTWCEFWGYDAEMGSDDHMMLIKKCPGVINNGPDDPYLLLVTINEDMKLYVQQVFACGEIKEIQVYMPESDED